MIVPQTVRSYQPAFSAAFVAYVELNYKGNKEKNRLCGVVPLPDRDTDWLTGLAATMRNQLTWGSDKTLRAWMTKNRLDGFSHLVRGRQGGRCQNEDHSSHEEQRLPAMMKLQQFIQELNQMEQKELNNPQFQVEKNSFSIMNWLKHLRKRGKLKMDKFWSKLTALPTQPIILRMQQRVM